MQPVKRNFTEPIVSTLGQHTFFSYKMILKMAEICVIDVLHRKIQLFVFLKEVGNCKYPIVVRKDAAKHLA